MDTATQATKTATGAVKTSISLPALIHTIANQKVREEGYTSFSEYVHFLIRRDDASRKHRRPA